MSREDIFNYTAPTMGLYRSLEVEIFRSLAEQLKANGEVNIDEWKIKQMQQYGMFNNRVIKLLSDYTGVATFVIEQAIREVADIAIEDVDGALSPYLGDRVSNIDTHQIIDAYKKQTFIHINNHVNQTLISTNYGHGVLSKMYNDIVDKTTLGFISGTMSFHEALERTIIEWTDRGVPATFVDKGGNLWSLERYIDTVLRSTFNRTYNKIRSSRMEEFDVHTALMGTVPDAAERCARCQGQVLDMRPREQANSGYQSIYDFGYGEPDGTQGIGCRHPMWPFIPGVSVNNQPQYDPEESIRKSKYRNRQRELERRIRATKKRILVLESLESSNLPRQKRLLRAQQEQMRTLLGEATWLRRQPKNEKVYIPLPQQLKEYYLRPSGQFGEEGYHEFWDHP